MADFDAQENSCTRKKAFATQYEADKAAEYSTIDQNRPMTAYHCKYHDHYHIGHERPLWERSRLKAETARTFTTLDEFINAFAPEILAETTDNTGEPLYLYVFPNTDAVYITGPTLHWEPHWMYTGRNFIQRRYYLSEQEEYRVQEIMKGVLG